MKEFARAVTVAFDRYFGKLGNRQVHLWLLATHPDFRRRGAGTMLCNWGMEKAKEKGHPITVLASPMGKQLYMELGYRFLGSVHCQVDDEEELFEVACLILNESDMR